MVSFSLKKITKLRKKIYFKLLKYSKMIYHKIRFKNNNLKDIVFIIGCQRSGTTLTLDIFEKDLNTKIYGEFSKLSSTSNTKLRHNSFNSINKEVDTKLRLNPLDLVKDMIDKENAPLIILKPLVESQNILKLLDYFPDSKALWIYRHYKDVAASYIAHWGPANGIDELRPILNEEQNNWRAENVPENIRNIIKQYFSDDMNPYDAAALFWFVRNSFFFELSLNNNSNVKLCRYNDLVTSPSKVIKKLYNFIGYNYPGDRIISNIFSSSIKKGKDIKLSPDIDHLCKGLLEKLDNAYKKD